MNRTSVIFENPYAIELKKEPLSKSKAGQVLIQAQFSGISPGSELLVYRGLFPPNIPVDTTIKGLTQPFGYPLKYGYTMVGKIIEIGPTLKKEWLGRQVFCFHPHESHFLVSIEDVIPIPQDIDPSEAVFLPSMETAVNFVMDGRPLIGEQVVVFGQGVVGLMTTALLAAFPLASLVTLEPFLLRRNKSHEFGAKDSLDPHEPEVWDELNQRLKSGSDEGAADLVFELSGNPDALNQAIAIAGYASRIVVGSWYGVKTANLKLGEKFHRNRIRLISSQVSTLAPEYSGRWTKSRRLDVVWDMIRKIKPAQLITHRFPVNRIREAFDLLDKRPEKAIQVLLDYTE